MSDILCSTLELSILFPGMLLAYLPMKPHLRMRPAKLITVTTPLLVFLCLIFSFVCYSFRLKTVLMLFPAVLLCGIFYIHTLTICHWKSISVFLAVCAVFTCLGSIIKAFHSMLYPESRTPWLSIETTLLYVLICWAFVIIAWYPATHNARNLLEDENLAHTWYVFWILPLLFIGLNLFMLPIHPEILQEGRLIQIYIIISLALLVLLLLFYAMFYLMAASLNQNNQLKQENLFLSMQQMQYNNLRTAISETREARHDMRHHLNIMQTLAKRKEWSALEDYLSMAKAAVPDTILNLCENPAIDSVAGHYAMLYKKNDISFSIELDLPHALPVPEIDFCLILSNLLENALEASLRTSEEKRYIHVQSFLHSHNVLVLTVENAFDDIIKEKEGLLQSSKHTGSGIGTQSVRRIAEKNGGYCHFTYENGVFHANIMLRRK